VIQGDCITDIDLTHLIKTHQYYSGLATIATYYVDEPWKYGVVDQRDDGLVKQFIEKPPVEKCPTNQVNTGIYVMEPEAMDSTPPNTKFDFAKDLFPILLERQSIYACPYTKEYFWVDVGQPNDYCRAQRWMMDRLKSQTHESALISGEIEGPVVLGADSVVEDGALIEGPVVLGDNVVVGEKCVLKPYTCVQENTRILDGTLLEGTIIFDSNTIGKDNEIKKSFIGEKCTVKNKGIIQDNVLVGPGCTIEAEVAILEGSRIWPGIHLERNSIIDGTLKKFIQTQKPLEDAKWGLRVVTPDEAFYFNKQDANHIVYTGMRARSLLEFTRNLKEVDLGSLEYHLRDNTNDFKDWVNCILGDMKLSQNFKEIKTDYQRNLLSGRDLRKAIYSTSTRRLRELIEEIKPPGYI
jgi:NDP-sugar pyrophosphorylase family protein